MRVFRRITRRCAPACGFVALACAGVTTSAAADGPGLPRTYDVKRIDSTQPIQNGSFGWGVASADLTGDRKADLLVAQSQQGPGQIFIYNGVTGAPVDTINAPETNDDGTPPVLAFVYVETMPDIGSCSGGDGPDADKICDATSIGLPDGIPEILAGSRSQQVPTVPGGGGATARPKIGRGYVFDGATRAVLRIIDMPLADRQSQLALGAQPQFGRVMASPQGMAPCNGGSAENNAVGVGPCPTDFPTPDAVRLGDVDGAGKPDIVVTARSFTETPAQSAAGSQCSTQTANCQSGKAWVYRGEDVVAGDPHVPLETALHSIQNPESQGAPNTRVPPIGNVEFGGNLYKIGDVTNDNRPDYVIPARNMDYPLRTPDVAFTDVGMAFIVNGATGAIIGNRYLTSPQPQPRSQFSGSFNTGRAVGNVGASTNTDILLPASLQNVHSTDDGILWAFNGDGAGGGGATGSFQFASLTDPTPMLGGNFGGSLTGVGDLMSDFANPGNEVLIGGYNFDPQTEATNRMIGDVHFMNVTMEKSLQTIVDPDRQAGSGFGVGLVPMGDLNGDGFLDFAASSYLSNQTYGGQGRAFIFTSNNTPLPAAEPTPTPTPTPSPTPTPAPVVTKQLQAGACVQRIEGTAGADTLAGTLTGDTMFGLGGDDVARGFDGNDCIDGGSGADKLDGGSDGDRLVGRGGNDALSGGDDRDRLYGSGGRDRLSGGYGRDLLAGGDDDDRLDGGPDADTLYGEAGDDVLIAGDGRNRLDGGAGDDEIRARNGERDVILCGKGKDVATVDRNDSVNGCERVKRSR